MIHVKYLGQYLKHGKYLINTSYKRFNFIRKDAASYIEAPRKFY